MNTPTGFEPAFAAPPELATDAVCFVWRDDKILVRSGEPPTLRTVSSLGHGGVLTREMRFRFPTYARELEAPDG